MNQSGKFPFQIRIALISICLGISLTACQLKHKPGWLEGSWEIRRDETRSRLEIWTEVKPGQYHGKGIKVVGPDTTLLESIRLYSSNGKLIYEPTVPDQNQGKAIPFTATMIETHRIIFENPDHDFPQRIIYEYKPVAGDHMKSMPGDSLYARVEDLSGDGFDLKFVRI